MGHELCLGGGAKMQYLSEELWVRARSRTSPRACETQRTERSRQLAENKRQAFPDVLQSRQLSENKRVIFVKPSGY
jgi:hypothetical protein